MAKKRKVYPCSKCKRKYYSLKPNFYKKAANKSGYDYQCKKCNQEAAKKWYNSLEPERKAEIQKKNLELKKKARDEGRYDEHRKNYLPRRREIWKLNKFGKIAQRMQDKLYPEKEEFKWEGSSERKALVNAGLSYSEEKELLTNQIINK